MTNRHVDDILGDFWGLPLAEQLRASAGCLERLCLREGWDTCTFGPSGLRATADEVEAEDRAKAEQDAIVEELARWLSIHIGTWPEDEWNLRAKPNYWHDKARELMEAGWRKGGSDE